MVSSPRDAGQLWGALAGQGLGVFPVMGCFLSDAGSLQPFHREVGLRRQEKQRKHFPLSSSFISQAETDSLRCKTKCQEKDVCYTERCCCHKPACLSLAAFCSASSTDKVIQRFCPVDLRVGSPRGEQERKEERAGVAGGQLPHELVAVLSSCHHQPALRVPARDQPLVTSFSRS